MMRQKVKRRWFACLWTTFLVFLLWWFISVARRNVQAVYSSSSHYQPPEVSHLKLVIVEEHHEALVAWADAFSRGITPPNATLVHIDAEARDTPPTITTKFPDFRPPRTEEEVEHMIQGSERCIRVGQVTQMLSRVVWIFPFWNFKQPLYRSRIVYLGRTMSHGVNAVCECEKLRTGNLTCSAVLDRSRQLVPARECSIRQQVESEAIRDVYARTRLPVEKGWLGNGPLVLDIDEDFFGLRLVASQLLETGLHWRDVVRASEAIAQLLCPKNPTHERAADRWFAEVVSTLARSCADGTKAGWCVKPEAALIKFLRSEAADANLSGLLCAEGKEDAVDVSSHRAFLNLWRILRVLNSAQLLALRRAGVCLSRSMRGLEKPQLHLCVGNNVPNGSVVTEHYPSASELDQQFERVRAILTALPRRPRLITVARSARDGYVPRDLQAHIEQRLLAVLRDVFKLKDEDVVFDTQLLNGRRGDWGNRHS